MAAAAAVLGTTLLATIMVLAFKALTSPAAAHAPRALRGDEGTAEPAAADVGGGVTSATALNANATWATGTYDLRAMGPPRNALAYRGLAWPAMAVPGAKAIHVFAIGDWGGLDGSLLTEEGRPRLISYKGGHLPGPHIFPSSRWNRAHNVKLCNGTQLSRCFEGEKCPDGCAYLPGVDDQAQLLVAAAVKARAAGADPAFFLNVGDNFYWGGIEKTCGTPMGEISHVARHQFDQIYEGIYSGPGITGKPWLSVLGNHDWGGRVFNNGWDQQIAYTWASNRWVMPAPYYSQHVEFTDQGFTADIYMLDTNFLNAYTPDEDPEHNICGAKYNRPDSSCSPAAGPPSVDACQGWFSALWSEQQRWLEAQLAASTATWQIVVTHFPCGHEAAWYRKLRSQYGLDLLVTGHRHDQELWANSGLLGGLTCFVTGGGGGITSEAGPGLDRSAWYGEGQYGFYDLTISKTSIKVESINYDGKVLASTIVQPTP